MAYLKIDTTALRTWAESQPLSAKEICASVGRAANYLSHTYATGQMQNLTHTLLVRTYGLPDDAFLVKETKPAPAPAPVEITGPEHPGYWADLKVHPRTVDFTIHFNAEGADIEVIHAYSKIIGNTELDIIKAISYAAHMAYKLAEQKILKGN